ncbi:MBL fold metallo-hydrolase [Rhodococcus sp. IEGM 1307]|jgi:glyoxylase-like metal-dependent hydrolase (beta-lactamase superfamily II)|uniref:MBL fold metallo-hydrolase n=1 Tax=Rhodococcus sp. IEGM 1307 TaxID=3047091 RepID=UPI0024B6C397|nr:MBL fold metallo-hydrolase [Rhodococcus sp. IEGM 1307]MDI9978866.1 MBL fold metallo-hydrolase [Rhodococcus sp. IEGM 1307]
MKVGSGIVVPLLDGSGVENPRDVLFRAESTVDAWAEHEDLLDSQGNLELAVGGYLVRLGDRNILVDAGVGTIDNGKYRGGQFLESLRLQGLEPSDITDVIFTHLHFDHVGWATKKGAVVFENATYRVHKLDWDHFVESPSAEPGAVRKLKPLESRLELFAGDETLAPGFDARHTPGHSPGSTTFIVSSENASAALIGDLAHTPIELVEPHWHFAFDFDPVAAALVRSEFVAEFADTDTTILAAHFPGMRGGHLVTDNDTTTWTYNKENR